MLHNVASRKLLITILIILGSGTLISQVNIKERVEIKPRPPLQRLTTESPALFAANPDAKPGRNQMLAILVVYPCNVTVTGSLEIRPNVNGGYPATDMVMLSPIGGAIASYMGYPNGVHNENGGTTSFPCACGVIGVALSNSMGYDEVTHVTRTIGASSATIVFEGKLLWSEFTATATFSAEVDDGYDLESVELTSDSSQITQCLNTTYLHTKLRNKKGKVYNGIPCQPPPAPMTLTVEGKSDIQLSCSGQQGKQLTLPVGDVGVLMSWNYQGEPENSTATVALAAEGDTDRVSVELNVDKTVTNLEFESIEDVLHLMKTKVKVRVFECSFWGADSLLDGSPVDLEIIEGAGFGCLLDPKTGQQGKKLTGVRSKDGFVEVEYWANGVYPTQRWETVIIRATSGAPSGWGELSVSPGDLIVTLGRSEIAFGDTTAITLGVRSWDGSISPVPQTWNTMHEIVEADTIGYFYAWDSSKAGSPLIGQYPNARFYARSYSSPPDSVVVVMKVTAVDTNGGWVTKIVDGGHPSKGQPQTKSIRQTTTASQSPGEKKNSVTTEPPDLGEGARYYGAAQLVVKKGEPLDHFLVTLEKDTIAFTETSRIYVQAKDAKDDDIEFSLNERLTFVLDGTESMYARFINSASDTVLYVENAKYEDAKQGETRIAAVHQNPLNPVSVKLRVVQASDLTKGGEAQLQIVQQTIKLVLQGPQEIWPVLPPYTQDKPYKDNTTLVEVQMTRNGKPLAGHPFKLSSDYVAGSGGHDHNALNGVYTPERRPNKPQAEMFRNYGMFVSSQRDPSQANANPVEEKTLQNGKAAFGYVASHFGDKMVIRVESKKSSLLFDTMSILEKVPNLELLPDIPTKYRKIGGTIQHHGPSDKSEAEVPSDCRTPDNNHWGMEATLASIDSIAANYHKFFPNDSMLYVNDMSLPLGGRFDINGLWKGRLRHQYHRFGQDVDFRSSTISIGDSSNDLNRNGQYDAGEPIVRDVNRNGKYERNRRGFEDIAKFFGAVEILLEDPQKVNEHYHLFFWNRNQ